MSPLVELITAWDEFTTAHPENINVEAFCRDFLDAPSPKRRSNKKTALGLARRIGRVAAIQRTCTRLAFLDMPGIEPEWYYFLHSINEEVEVRKTAVISINLLLEPTTGIDILNRMIKAGLLREELDPADKRSRLLRLTRKGQTILQKAEDKVKIITDMLFTPNLGEIWAMVDDYLGLTEYEFGPLLTEHRPKSMDELLQLYKSGYPPSAS